MIYQHTEKGLRQQIQHLADTAQAALQLFGQAEVIGFGVEDDATTYVLVFGEESLLQVLDPSQAIQFEFTENAVFIRGKARNGAGVHYVFARDGNVNTDAVLFRDLMAKLAVQEAVQKATERD